MSLRNFIEMLMLVALYYLGLSYFVDPDLWWHLKTGEWTLLKGLPLQDVFSWTQTGKEWVQHKWLFQIVLWHLFEDFGFAGLIVFFALLLPLTGLFVYLRSDGKPIFAALLTLMLGAVVAPVWGMRSQMVTAFMFSFFLFFLERIQTRAWPFSKSIWLPVLMAIWANLHGGYLVGIFLIGIFMVAEWVESREATRGGKKLNLEFLGLLIISLCATLIHPNGVGLLVNNFQTILSPVQRNFILEWRSINFHDPNFFPMMVLILLFVLSLMIKKRKMRVAEMLLGLGTLYLALISIRHIYYFVIAVIPTISKNFYSFGSASDWKDSFLLRQSEQSANLGRKVCFAVILVLTVISSALMTQSYYYHFTDRVLQLAPGGAVRFLKQNELIHRRIFNLYDWGGYLIFNGVPVFIDGRADMYGDDFFRNYLRIQNREPGWQELLKEQKIEIVLFPFDAALSESLKSSSEWKVIYSDEISIIFERVK